MRGERPTVEILYFSGCPNHEPALGLTREVASELGVDALIREVPVETLEAAEALRFVGSPTVRVNGRDIEPAARERTDYALGCRVYRDGGLPPRELLVEALREAS